MSAPAAAHPGEADLGERAIAGRGVRLGLGPAALAAGIICVAPSAATVAMALAGLGRPAGPESLTLALEAATGLGLCLVFGGGGALALGLAAAWATAMCEFPGRRLFTWALALPLAAPAYILAYAYGGLTGPGGPAPVPLRGVAGLSLVYALAFYPYVYLAARAAFATQSVCALEAARSLGAGPWRTAFTVALPAARGGIAAGAALALMEIAADYGAAAYFGVRTVTTGVFHAWFARGEPALALQMASALLAGAAVLLWIEQRSRSEADARTASARWRPLPRARLSGLAAAGASAACAALLALAVIAPIGWLVRLALLSPSTADLGRPLAQSLILAAAGAAAALTAALVIAAAARGGSRAARWAGRLASAGYAAPGAVLALGVMATLAGLREVGLAAGLTGAWAIAALIWAYAARFAAAGLQPAAAGLERATPAISGAAATLGAGPWRRFWRVEAPIAAPAVLAAALILFVEVLRELPATLILRPFDFDTLAVRAHAYAADDRLAQAATPSLLIVAAGLGPILLLTQRMLRARAGAA